eukprot:4068665-Heterocapsa_arctica.AAC.1
MQRSCAAGTGRPLHPDVLATGRPCIAWLAAELGAGSFRFEPLHIFGHQEATVVAQTSVEHI